MQLQCISHDFMATVSDKPEVTRVLRYLLKICLFVPLCNVDSEKETSLTLILKLEFTFKSGKAQTEIQIYPFMEEQSIKHGNKFLPDLQYKALLPLLLLWIAIKKKCLPPHFTIDLVYSYTQFCTKKKAISLVNSPLLMYLFLPQRLIVHPPPQKDNNR